MVAEALKINWQSPGVEVFSCFRPRIYSPAVNNMEPKTEGAHRKGDGKFLSDEFFLGLHANLEGSNYPELCGMNVGGLELIFHAPGSFCSLHIGLQNPEAPT